GELVLADLHETGPVPLLEHVGCRSERHWIEGIHEQRRVAGRNHHHRDALLVAEPDGAAGLVYIEAKVVGAGLRDARSSAGGIDTVTVVVAPDATVPPKLSPRMLDCVPSGAKTWTPSCALFAPLVVHDSAPVFLSRTCTLMDFGAATGL